MANYSGKDAGRRVAAHSRRHPPRADCGRSWSRCCCQLRLVGAGGLGDGVAGWPDRPGEYIFLGALREIRTVVQLLHRRRPRRSRHGPGWGGGGCCLIRNSRGVAFRTIRLVGCFGGAHGATRKSVGAAHKTNWRVGGVGEAGDWHSTTNGLWNFFSITLPNISWNGGLMSEHKGINVRGPEGG